MDTPKDRFKADFQHRIINSLDKGKKVVSFCSSYSIAKGVVDMA